MSEDPHSGDKVFICHADKDKGFVEQFVSSLQLIAVDQWWFDKISIVSGVSALSQIEKAISETKRAIVIFSNEFVSSSDDALETRKFEVDIIKFHHDTRAINVLIPIYYNFQKKSLPFRYSSWADDLTPRSFSDGEDIDKFAEFIVDQLKQAAAYVESNKKLPGSKTATNYGNNGGVVQPTDKHTGKDNVTEKTAVFLWRISKYSVGVVSVILCVFFVFYLVKNREYRFYTVMFHLPFRYKGGVNDGKANGYGRATFDNGIKEDGVFKDGKREGEFSVLDTSEKFLYREFYRNDTVLKYFGYLSIFSGYRGWYSGDVTYDRKLTGGATVKLEVGGSISGTFEDGIVIKGTADIPIQRVMTSGSDALICISYVGQITGDANGIEFNGDGKVRFTDGGYYEGNFKNGLFDGEGTLVRKDFTKNGPWELGKQVLGKNAYNTKKQTVFTEHHKSNDWANVPRYSQPCENINFGNLCFMNYGLVKYEIVLSRIGKNWVKREKLYAMNSRTCFTDLPIDIYEYKLSELHLPDSNGQKIPSFRGPKGLIRVTGCNTDTIRVGYD